MSLLTVNSCSSRTIGDQREVNLASGSNFPVSSITEKKILQKRLFSFNIWIVIYLITRPSSITHIHRAGLIPSLRRSKTLSNDFRLRYSTILLYAGNVLNGRISGLTSNDSMCRNKSF